MNPMAAMKAPNIMTNLKPYFLAIDPATTPEIRKTNCFNRIAGFEVDHS